jgi:hypothetical protein
MQRMYAIAAIVGLLPIAGISLHAEERKQPQEPPAVSDASAQNAKEEAGRACVDEQQGQEYFDVRVANACMVAKGHHDPRFRFPVSAGTKIRFGASTRF